MDEFDFIEEKPKRQINFGGIIWNLATMFLLLTALFLGAVMLSILVNPYVSYNPFPPPTTIPTIALPTAAPTSTITALPSPTNTLIFTGPTQTHTPGAPTETQAPPPSETPVPGIEPSATATLSAANAEYAVQDGNPAQLDSTLYQHLTDLGCGYMGVAGQALNAEDAPVVGLTVEVRGDLAGETIDEITITGAATNFGPGGYEVRLAGEPIQSNGTLQIQLKDVSGNPLSEVITFDTSSECELNLTLINFVQQP